MTTITSSYLLIQKCLLLGVDGVFPIRFFSTRRKAEDIKPERAIHNFTGVERRLPPLEPTISDEGEDFVLLCLFTLLHYWRMAGYTTEQVDGACRHFLGRPLVDMEPLLDPERWDEGMGHLEIGYMSNSTQEMINFEEFIHLFISNK